MSTAATSGAGPPVYSIGHSNRTIEQLVELLRLGEVETLVDIRSIRRSRANPQFNFDSFPGSLSDHGIAYAFIPELGGLRKRDPSLSPDVNGFWINLSFHNYADHALSAEFETGLGELLEMSRDRHCAIMCAEAVWWRCHRRIVTDYLLLRGRTVFHIMEGRLDPALMTPAARRRRGRLVYPPQPD